MSLSLCVLVTRSCPTLCDPMDCCPPGNSPLSMEFSRQEYWSGFPFPSPGYLLDPGIEFQSSTLQADYLPFEPSVKVLITPSCPTLCNPMDCNPPDSPVHEILQARIME